MLFMLVTLFKVSEVHMVKIVRDVHGVNVVLVVHAVGVVEVGHVVPTRLPLVCVIGYCSRVSH